MYQTPTYIRHSVHANFCGAQTPDLAHAALQRALTERALTAAEGRLRRFPRLDGRLPAGDRQPHRLQLRHRQPGVDAPQAAGVRGSGRPDCNGPGTRGRRPPPPPFPRPLRSMWVGGGTAPCSEVQSYLSMARTAELGPLLQLYGYSATGVHGRAQDRASPN
jgi:hypothetical protein